MKIIILHKKFVDDGEIIIGGIETYIRNLCALCHDLGWEVIVAQPETQQFIIEVEGIKIVGVDCGKTRHRQRRQRLANWALDQIDKKQDIILFAADWFSVPIDYPRTIHIQHGITWDMPRQRVPWTRLIAEANEQLRHAKLFENSQYKVCVDYNFLNWYRTLRSAIDERQIEVIPNFASLSENVDLTRHQGLGAQTIKVLFARRLVPMRGTHLMAEASKKLLATNKRPIEICFAGDGPDEEWLKHQFATEPRVSFCRYHPCESGTIHQRHHIAVVPSIGSEGTSLSLIEAMAAGCAVVCTNIGGMTNLVIDEFNGRMVKPDSMALLAALETLIEDDQRRQQLATQALAVAQTALSLERWRHRWSTLLNRIASA